MVTMATKSQTLTVATTCSGLLLWFSSSVAAAADLACELWLLFDDDVLMFKFFFNSAGVLLPPPRAELALDTLPCPFVRDTFWLIMYNKKSKINN